MARIATVAVVGAGRLGRGIAHVAALGGYRTVVEDLLPSSLRKAEHEFRVFLDRATGIGEVSEDGARSAFSRLEYAGSVEEAARQADLVIEAVPDELESKSEIFILLDKICRPATILATTTLSLSISQLANVTYRAPFCVGMRLIPPVYEMKRLEVVRGQETSDDVLAAVCAVGKSMLGEVSVVEDFHVSAPELSANPGRHK